nr:hypothetical protein [Bacteroidota bacterium]
MWIAIFVMVKVHSLQLTSPFLKLILFIVFAGYSLHGYSQSDTLFYWNNIAKPCTITFITDDDILFKTVAFSGEQTVSKKQIQAYWRDGQFYLYKKGFYVKQDSKNAITHTIPHKDGGSEMNSVIPEFGVGPLFHARNCQIAGAACLFAGFSTQFIIAMSKPDYTKANTVKTINTISQIAAGIIILGAGLELNGVALLRKNTKRTSMLMGVGTDGAYCAIQFYSSFLIFNLHFHFGIPLRVGLSAPIFLLFSVLSFRINISDSKKDFRYNP